MKKLRILGLIATTGLALSVGLAAHAEDHTHTEREKTMDVRTFDKDKGFKGPEEYFTGNVQVDEPFASGDNFDDYKGAMVHFDAGARTAWHTHPKGQTLYITEGEGRVQSEGEAVKTVYKGDVVWFPANEKHWHGAAPDKAMSHMAIQSPDENGEVVTWLEKVSDEDYMAQK